VVAPQGYICQLPKPENPPDWIMTGTMGRNLLYSGGNVFLGVAGYGSNNWQLPSQILVCPAEKFIAGAPFAIECQLPLADSLITVLINANFPNTPNRPYIPVCGVWNTQGYGLVYSRQPATGAWLRNEIARNGGNQTATVRSLITYTDPDGGGPGVPVDLIFAGLGDDSKTPDFGGIYTARYVGSAPSVFPDWTQELNMDETNTPEQLAGAWNGSGLGVTLPQLLSLRVMSFAVGGNGKLYATVGIQIWERQNGPNPRWELVWTNPKPGTHSYSGIRGLTAITFQGNPSLLVAVDGTGFSILRLNINNFAPPNYGSTVVEYSKDRLDSDLYTIHNSTSGAYKTTVISAAYNNMLPLTTPSGSHRLIGLSIELTDWALPAPRLFEPPSPPNDGKKWLAQAFYLVRTANPLGYRLKAAHWPRAFNLNHGVAIRDFCSFRVGEQQYVAACGFDNFGRVPGIGQCAWCQWGLDTDIVD
jgi:hypothetical protein